jgi:4-amino-4-deoxy-L-arabinose transferase-like glycosyltransferase
MLGAALRFVNLSAPPLDFHSTRQLRNSLVARAIYYDALPSARPQDQQLARSFRRAVGQYEPPIIESIVGFTFLASGGESFAVPRIYGTLFWLVAGLALFDLGRRLFSPAAALLALAYYLVLPFSVQASRSFQPDPLMTATFAVGVYFLFRWMEEQTWKWAILGALFAGLAVLVKLVIVFLVAGAAIAVVLTVLGRRFWHSAQVWVMMGLMVAPATGYYVLGHPGRSTEYFVSWTVQLIRLITSPHFYADWLGYVGSLLGLSVLFLSVAGMCMAPRRFRSLLAGLWIGYVLYGLVLPFQMTTHSYYHLQLVPVAALGLMPVIQVVVDKASSLDRAWRAALVLLMLAFIGYESWAARSALAADDFRQSPALWSSIARAIPGNSDVIALTQDYGFDLMYWGWRKVDLWPLTTDLAALKNSSRDLAARFSSLTAGHRYFLVTAFGQLEGQPELRQILEGYNAVAQGPGYVLYDLQQSK